MFIQVIQGQVQQPEAVYMELDRWVKEVSRGTEGWVGSTAGVTSDGRFIGLARWESEDAARRHAARPEQDRWWNNFTKLFVAGPKFHETNDVFIDTPGDPNQAKFVQVAQGRATDEGRFRELMDAHRQEWATFRPEILGSVACRHGGGAFTMAVYFTTEEAARAGEAKEPPPALKADMEELDSLSVGTEIFDLHEPWIQSPA